MKKMNARHTYFLIKIEIYKNLSSPQSKILPKISAEMKEYIKIYWKNSLLKALSNFSNLLCMSGKAIYDLEG